MGTYDLQFMNAPSAALLVNLVGFTVGVALYAMLAAMVVRHRDRSESGSVNRLLFLTALLGLVWNAGELVVLAGRDFGRADGSPFLTAAAYSALGFLPSVVVHSVRITGRRRRLLVYGAYALSTFAAALHFWSAYAHSVAPSDFALRTLTFGALALAAALLAMGIRETPGSKSIWATALLIFAVSGLHLSSDSAENSWLVEMVAHQSSLPLVLAILYQNYRFAFADLFLKRAISLLLIALVAFGLYLFVAAPLLRYHESHGRNDVQAIGLIIALWIATALIYPAVHRFAVWVVDSLLLKRPDYALVQSSIAEKIERCETVDELMDVVTDELSIVLTAGRATWRELDHLGRDSRTGLVRIQREQAEIIVPTTERPAYEIVLENLGGGRRLLSEETTMLEAAALIVSRRIDAMRVVHERCEREFREQEFSKLATEAQLAALRAQINPHFLFNALTTIGYLIQTAPEKAFATLLQLTKLLRGVLSNSSEFCTVADEMKLIESYLDIERARFEERLAVSVEVPNDVKALPIPSLILQPLVENSIKHGISENKHGGEVKISAALVHEANSEFLELTVVDSGAGLGRSASAHSAGVGLQNVRERLRSHYGNQAVLSVETQPASGTRASIKLPIPKMSAAADGGLHS